MTVETRTIRTLNCDIEIKNYRPFADELPALLSLNSKYIALVGLNNVGKSALLRFFWELKPAFEMLSDPRKLFGASVGQLSTPYGTPSPLVHTNLNDRPLSFSVSLRERTETDVSRVVYSLFQGTPPRVELYKDNERLDLSASRLQDWTEPLEALAAETGALSTAIYAGPFRNAIAVSGEPYFGLEIGKGFIAKFDQLRAGGDPKARHMVRNLTAEIKEAFGFSHFAVHAAQGNDTLIIDDERGSHTLPEVGAGLSQFLILVLHAAVNRPRLMVIDEPELNLHPALQVKLLNMLGLYAGTVLFSTHNMGLARTIADRRYLIVKEHGGFARVTDEQSSPRLVEILGELSYSGRHDLGVNAVLWVEGTHDVPVIRHFLSLLKKEHQVLVLPLHGRNGIKSRGVDQLEELKRVTPHVYVLIDSEKDSPNAPIAEDRSEFLRKCGEARIIARATDYRAIENYFPGRAIKETFDASYDALTPYEKLSKAKKPWGKADNYKIALEMRLSELEDTDLGRFLIQINVSVDRPITHRQESSNPEAQV